MTKKILLPLGIDDFQELRNQNYYFVDKSLFIRDVIDDGAKIILIPRPRRFGKTLNLSMLYYYFAHNPDENYRALFEDLAIAQLGTQYTAHQNRYPVIFFTLKDIKDLKFEQAYQGIAWLMADLYKKHRYLLESEHLESEEKNFFQQIMVRKADETTLRNSLQELIRYLHRHHGVKPILLLDEYDSPIHTAYSSGYYDEMVRFMQVFLGGALKGNVDLHKAVITGILQVAQASIFSGLNNVTVYSVLKTPYSSYFGFQEDEIRALCEKSISVHTVDEIRDWYNGYQFGQTRVYNPWSILNFIHFAEPPQPYWVNVANNSLIKTLIENAKIDVKLAFEDLLQGQSIVQTIQEELVFPALLEKDSALWNLLLFTGYLTLSSSDPVTYPYQTQLRIPNKEVQYLFEEMVAQWFDTQQLSQKTYDQLLQSLVQHDTTAFARFLQAYIRESGSYFDFNLHTPEQVYHAFVLGLVVGLRDQFYVQSNRESGNGRFDVCLIPKQKDQAGILMEFKQIDSKEQLAMTASAALAQITDRQYDTVFRQQGISKILCLGVAFAARDVQIDSVMQILS